MLYCKSFYTWTFLRKNESIKAFVYLFKLCTFPRNKYPSQFYDDEDKFDERNYLDA